MKMFLIKTMKKTQTLMKSSKKSSKTLFKPTKNLAPGPLLHHQDQKLHHVIEKIQSPERTWSHQQSYKFIFEFQNFSHPKNSPNPKFWLSSANTPQVKNLKKILKL